MLFATRLSKLVGILLQTSAAIFIPFFRYHFGRRYFTLWNRVLLPFLLIVAAILVRDSFPPLAYLPAAPFMPPAEFQAAINAPTLAPLERAAFRDFALLFLVVASLQYVALWIQRALKRDNPGTRVWGRSWLQNLPGFNLLSQSAVQGKLEPLVILGAGYLLLQSVPAFGAFLLAGGVIYAWDNMYLWRQERVRELDARDALMEGQLQKNAHNKAKLRYERAAARQEGRIARQTLAKIQKTPHAILALSPEETAGAVEALGEMRFVELCKELPHAEQREVLSRLM